MQINSLPPIAAGATTPSTGSSSTSASTASSNANGLADPNLFISLLTAQLQAQDPLNPMSPQDMVSQLTEVSSLQQLVNINQTLTNISTGTASTTTSQPNPLG
jgi:flagellar basal-body rod modification protein FlgD